MINHIVMFRLAGTQPEVTKLALKFKQAIEALPFQIDFLVEANVFINENPNEQWTMVLQSKVDTWQQLADYAAHPAHVAAVAIIKPAIEQRACVDYSDQ